MNRHVAVVIAMGSASLNILLCLTFLFLLIQIINYPHHLFGQYSIFIIYILYISRYNENRTHLCYAYSTESVNTFYKHFQCEILSHSSLISGVS